MRPYHLPPCSHPVPHCFPFEVKKSTDTVLLLALDKVTVKAALSNRYYPR
jgi:hypothetical protein